MCGLSLLRQRLTALSNFFVGVQGGCNVAASIRARGGRRDSCQYMGLTLVVGRHTTTAVSLIRINPLIAPGGRDD